MMTVFLGTLVSCSVTTKKTVGIARVTDQPVLWAELSEWRGSEVTLLALEPWLPALPGLVWLGRLLLLKAPVPLPLKW